MLKKNRGLAIHGKVQTGDDGGTRQILGSGQKEVEKTSSLSGGPMTTRIGTDTTHTHTHYPYHKGA